MEWSFREYIASESRYQRRNDHKKKYRRNSPYVALSAECVCRYTQTPRDKKMTAEIALEDANSPSKPTCSGGK